MATWPGTLPQSFVVDGYTEGLPENRIETKVEYGPKKSRQRGTAATAPLGGKMHMTEAQLDIFKAFVKDDIAGGSLPFDMPHPRTQVTITVSFEGNPLPAARAIDKGLRYEIPMQLAVHP